MNLNKILYGPPGTGKTYHIQSLTENYVDYNISDCEIKQIYTDRSEDWLAVALIILQNNNNASVHQIDDKLQDIEINTNTSTSTILEQRSLNNDDHLTAHILPKVFVRNDRNWSVEFKNLQSFEDGIINDYFDEDIVKERYRFVTFHQSFAYEDFVEGIKPVLHSNEELEVDEAEHKGHYSNELSYEINDGVFKSICEEAKQEPYKDFAVFIDEINRGNISEIFGELITLLEDDKRIGEENELFITLPYSKEKFGVPNNLRVIGSMNTADRSIALIDIALRRRFQFESLYCNYNILKNTLNRKGVDAENINGVNIIKLLGYINKRIEVLMDDKNYAIGHAFFINIRNLEDVIEVMKNKVIPLLEEYFHDDKEKIQYTLNDLDENGDLKESAIFKHNLLEAETLFNYLPEYGLEDFKSFYVAETIDSQALKKVYNE
ncbi:5-methylcytosine-specific restriction protein B [Alkalibacillus flavidus]|uniref:5-methylcytosine-specific restriction protein B n=1 Tax=Alkalibacillus flavidus TaxID=546021 RepID=A0ABV2KU78_9BACI